MSIRGGVTVRGTSNGNDRGSAESRRRRRVWLVEIYRANVDLTRVEWDSGYVEVYHSVISPEQILEFPAVVSAVSVPSCRCYRCGCLLTVETVTVDRIIPGCQGGTYRRDNIRPACGPCNSETGGRLASAKIKKAAAKKTVVIV